MIRSALLVPLILSLSGCGALKALEGEPNRDVFELRAPTVTANRCGGTRVQDLVIELPKTRGTLDTERIMIRPSVLQTQYLPDAIWGDPVPATLQRLLVETLGSYDTFAHVGRAPLGISGDLAMISEIGEFNAQTSGEGAVIRLSVDAQLVREMDATIVGRGRFSATTQAPSTRTADLIPAFDAAAQELVAEMTAWTLGRVGVNTGSCR
ncbi:ABC-type transport auxiliary lipoprotein family protein [Paracoccus jeotgali]|uniref:ABC-type transport auxiliary lipoprotein component domain-containing protein n=1 Tax=Paracoccus jeotgali TaxID=2065379 RepID=A0A2K9MBL1_9RHOB|nr:ABC-type transport auxiliary lipoprotein family protein [Paracoccus jeotgali]AUM73014.1 hypothetical protein CYR75_00700 [Paracoccus jeotgali]